MPASGERLFIAKDANGFSVQVHATRRANAQRTLRVSRGNLDDTETSDERRDSETTEECLLPGCLHVAYLLHDAADISISSAVNDDDRTRFH